LKRPRPTALLTLQRIQRRQQGGPGRSGVQSASGPMPDPNRYVYVLICHRGSERLRPSGPAPWRDTNS